MKKNIYLFCIIIIIFNLLACKSRKIASFPTVAVSVLISNNDVAEGTIVVRCSGIGSNESEAVNEAEQKAFTTLLFYGYPGSTQITPLVEDESKAKSNNPTFFTQFLEKGGYKSFIILSSNYSTGTSVSKYYLVREIQINVRSLRNYLEQKNIIRKFGL